MSWRDRFPEIPEDVWGDWRWQQRNALRTADALARVVALDDRERRGLQAASGGFRVAVTPYYASLMDPEDPWCPVRMQAIPAPEEGVPSAGELRDPLGEERHRPVRAVIHRYRDRALFLVTDACPVYCRHCTRRRVTAGSERPFDRASLEEGLDYVRAHPELRDVIVSGGDPLVLSDDRLGWLLEALRAVPHVQILRLATRALVTCPMRVDDALARRLRAVKPLFVVTQFNHPKECTPEARAACERLVDHGVPVENQTVLLRRVNSSARTLIDLGERLLTWRVRPYYLHQGDLAEGTGHLRTPLSCGVAILEAMRRRTSGLAIPHLAVDLPSGGGKIGLHPDYRVDGVPMPDGAPGTWFRSPEGGRCFYPDPPGSDCSCPYDDIFYAGAPATGGPDT